MVWRPQAKDITEEGAEIMNSRREFIRNAAWASASAALGFGGRALAAEPPPETKTIRIAHVALGTCWAPQYVAGDLLRGEGFSDLRYVKVSGPGAPYTQLAAGEVDLTMSFIAPFILAADAGEPVVMLAGVHPGCIELVASERVRNVRELKGKAISVGAKGTASHGFAAAILAHVGLDPRRDVNGLEQGLRRGCRSLPRGRSTRSSPVRPAATRCARRKSAT